MYVYQLGHLKKTPISENAHLRKRPSQKTPIYQLTVYCPAHCRYNLCLLRNMGREWCSVDAKEQEARRLQQIKKLPQKVPTTINFSIYPSLKESPLPLKK